MKLKRNCIFLFFIASLVLLGAYEAKSATGIEEPAGKELLSEDLISEKIAVLGKTLDSISQKGSEGLASELGITNEQVKEKIKSLIHLRSAYMRLKNSQLALADSQKEQATTQQMYEDFHIKGMSRKPPYSLTFHDSVQAEISTITKNKQNTQFTIEILNKNIDDFKEQLSLRESELRQLIEKQGRHPDQKNQRDSLSLELARENIEYLKTMLLAFDAEKIRYKIDSNIADIQIKRLTEQERYISSNVHYDNADLEHQLELIWKNETEVREEIQKFQTDQEAIETEWIKAQQLVNSALTEPERNIAQAYLKSRNEWRKTYIVVLELKQETIKLMERQKNLWQNRYEIVKSEISLNRKKKIIDEVEKNRIGLSQTLQIQQNFLVNLQNQISAIDNLIKEEGAVLSELKHLEDERDALRRQFERRLEFQSIIIATDQIEKNLLSQIGKQLDQRSFEDQFSGLIQVITTLWNLEIWVVDQNSVSVGKIFTALIILVVGFLSARFFVHFIHRKLLSNSQIKESTSSAMVKGMSYFAYLMVFLLALRIVNIPLTAFAFLGGAVAIGVGFGAQNLINNFISGFIILGERPIHIGDLIEVDGLLGKVEEIGARCTRVRTGENVHKLIPNSSFLEKNITNWTLSDNRIRTKITVGVAYGSPTKKVEELLLKAVHSNQTILKTPDPLVLFSDFGDNALIFEVYFWIMIRMVLEKKQIESQVRFEIDSLFNEENIVISFPQRDIHFDTDKPLRINLAKELTSREVKNG